MPATDLIRFCRRVFQQAKGKIRGRDLLSPRKWRYWIAKTAQEFQRVRLDAQWTAAGGSGSRLTPYEAYQRANAICQPLRNRLAEAVETFDYRPRISIIMPVYETDPEWLHKAVASVSGQIYPDWELCIADDCSRRTDTLEALEELGREPRVNVVLRDTNGHICAASNTAARMATGEFLVLMDHDDELAATALFEVVRLLQTHRDADVIYSDEDKIAPDGTRYDPHFKPDWSPTLFLGYNYINHMTCIRRELFNAVGGFRHGWEGAQDYDLLLRASAETDRIHHIPKILYHWRAVPQSTAKSARVKPIVARSASAALQDHLDRIGISADTYTPEPLKAHGLPVYQLDGRDRGPSVTVIIPTRNQPRMLSRCVGSLLEKTTYADYTLLVIDNASDLPEAGVCFDRLRQKGVRVEKIANDCDGFSFAAICNQAARLARTDYLLFLNDDTEVIEPRWLTRLMTYAGLPGVGAAGARLLYPDHTIQHAGVVLRMSGGIAPGHAFHRDPADLLSYFFLAETARETSAVTGACLLTPRARFLSLGGFDQKRYRVSLNDVDYCLRLKGEGLRTIYVPGAELRHHESVTRTREDDPTELAAFSLSHGSLADPYYSPNLSDSRSFALDPSCGLDYMEFLNRPLKVAFFAHNLNLEGATRVVINLARNLKKRGGIDPIVVSFMDGPGRKNLEDAGIRCLTLPLPGTGNILQGWPGKSDLGRSIELVGRLLTSETPDVVFANVVNCFFVVNAAADKNLPSLWMIHESYDRRQLLDYLPPFALDLFEAAFEQANQVIFVSNATRELFRRYDRLLNMTVIHNRIRKPGPGREDVEQGNPALRKSLDIDPDQTVILNVGTVCERKDQATLVRAAARLAKERADFCCFLVGGRHQDIYSSSVQRLIQRLGVEDRVRIIEETPEVNRYYSVADIFAFTSLNESYSLTILEAMAGGLAIVTTSCHGIAEQVRFGVNALHFGFSDDAELAERLRYLLDHKEVSLQMGSNSRKMWQYMGSFDQMLSTHERLIQGAWQQGCPDKVFPEN